MRYFGFWLKISDECIRYLSQHVLCHLLFLLTPFRGRGDDGRLGHGDNGWKYVPRLTHSLTGQIVTRSVCTSKI